jgi:hypothetical protein
MAPHRLPYRPARRSSTEGAAQPLTTFLKTKMCTFHQLGACARGSSCRYAHDEQDLNPESFYRTRFCKSIIRFGKCENADCTYAHRKHELREPPSAASGVAEDQSFIPVSRMVDELPDDQREQLLKYHLLRLPASHREQITSWLLQQNREEVPSSQKGKRDVQESHPRPLVWYAAYPGVTQEQRVQASEPVRVDMPGWANEVAACASPAATGRTDGSIADINVVLQGHGFEIKNSFVSEVPPKRPELRRQGNTIGCLPQLELSTEQCQAIEEKRELHPLDVCLERSPLA